MFCIKDYFDITIIYNNSNIYPEAEYLRRKEELKRFLSEVDPDIKVIEIPYDNINYMKDLNMAVVSNYISMNYSMLSYLFKQYTGTNFVNYLKGIRIKEAKKLLSDTDMKIIEVSRAVGYDNEKHFMKTFKAECGVSPGEYRKNMQRQ